jgi:hypothetical protein
MSYFFQIVIMALSVFVHQLYSKYYDSTPCGSDSPIEIDGIWFLDDDDNDRQRGGYIFQDTCALFSSEYFEAREKFRNAVKKYNTTLMNNPTTTTGTSNSNSDASVAATAETAHAELWSSLVAVMDGNGPLTLDVAVLPGNTKELGTIVHSSGVHGVEGYAGSAIQLALLELLTWTSQKSEGKIDAEHRPTIVMVHAVNPVGMNQYRRCNENNVDLNRNGIILSGGEANHDSKNGDSVDVDNNNNNKIHDDGIYASFQDFLNKRDPNIAGYDDFRHLFVPEIDTDNGDESNDNLSLYETTIGFYVRAIPALAKHGMAALKRGMVAGQYHHPEGLNYGGQELQSSVQRLFDTFVRDRPEFFRDSPHVLWIDVHTGLGAFGKDSVVRNAHIEHNPEGRRNNEDDPELDDYLTTAYSVTSSVDGERSTAQAFKGYDLSKGMLMEFLGDSYRKIITLQSDSGGDDDRGSKEGIFLVQEFGTLPSIFVGRALILDNLLYHFRKNRHHRRRSNTNEEGRGRRDDDEGFSYRSPFLGYAFYPQSTEWRSSIIRRGVAIVLQGMEYSTARSKSRLS